MLGFEIGHSIDVHDLEKVTGQFGVIRTQFDAHNRHTPQIMMVNIHRNATFARYAPDFDGMSDDSCSCRSIQKRSRKKESLKYIWHLTGLLTDETSLHDPQDPPLIDWLVECR
jgi:hypothetical protein